MTNAPTIGHPDRRPARQTMLATVPPEATLREIDLVTAPEDTPVEEVGRLMVDAGVRHALVGPAGHPDAIVSMRDVMAVLLGPASGAW